MPLSDACRCPQDTLSSFRPWISESSWTSWAKGNFWDSNLKKLLSMRKLQKDLIWFDFFWKYSFLLTCLSSEQTESIFPGKWARKVLYFKNQFFSIFKSPVVGLPTVGYAYSSSTTCIVQVSEISLGSLRPSSMSLIQQTLDQWLTDHQWSLLAMGQWIGQ